jgi:protein tyrosine phosphatase
MTLTLFTNITEELTDLEKNTLVPMLLDTLKMTDEKHRVKGRHFSNWFHACRFEVSEARIRKMVNYIRVTNAAKPKVLIGASTGYFLTDDVRVVDEQIESLNGRVDSMQAVIDSLKSQRENLKHSK